MADPFSNTRTNFLGADTRQAPQSSLFRSGAIPAGQRRFLAVEAAQANERVQGLESRLLENAVKREERKRMLAANEAGSAIRSELTKLNPHSETYEEDRNRLLASNPDAVLDKGTMGLLNIYDATFKNAKGLMDQERIFKINQGENIRKENVAATQRDIAFERNKEASMEASMEASNAQFEEGLSPEAYDYLQRRREEVKPGTPAAEMKLRKEVERFSASEKMKDELLDLGIEYDDLQTLQGDSEMLSKGQWRKAKSAIEKRNKKLDAAQSKLDKAQDELDKIEEGVIPGVDDPRLDRLIESRRKKVAEIKDELQKLQGEPLFPDLVKKAPEDAAPEKEAPKDEKASATPVESFLKRYTTKGK